jgi:hypothetical protein
MTYQKATAFRPWMNGEEKSDSFLIGDEENKTDDWSALASDTFDSRERK